MTNIPIHIPLEEVAIGTLKQIREITDEAEMRVRWQASEGQSLEMRVSKLLLNNGPEYHIVLNTLRAVMGQ
jgi:hypothetical protein